MLLIGIATSVLAATPAVHASISARQASPPACAGPCLVQAIAQSGSCSPSDTACLCTSQTVIEAISSCLTSACSETDLATSRQLLYSYCTTGGITIASLLPGTKATATTAGSLASSSPTIMQTSSDAMTSSSTSFESGLSVGAATGASSTTAPATGLSEASVSAVTSVAVTTARSSIGSTTIASSVPAVTTSAPTNKANSIYASPYLIMGLIVFSGAIAVRT